MKAYTLRGIDDRLYQTIQEEARKAGKSMNKYMLEVLSVNAEGGAGASSALPKVDLSRFFGCWSQEVADQFQRSVQEQRRIEPEMWA